MEETIKKIMLAKYPNGEQFYINNKKEFEQIWKEAQKELLLELEKEFSLRMINEPWNRKEGMHLIEADSLLIWMKENGVSFK